MGYVDQTTHTLTCICGKTESATVLERGSQYGSSWGAGKPFGDFEVIWKEGSFRGPEISSAKCKSCGGTPKVSVL